MRSFERSDALFQRASRRIPLASQTFSKSYLQYVQGASPLFLERGRGCRVWDVDGHEYIDFVLGLLPIVLGYCDPDVDEAIQRQLERGITFSLATELETELAEELGRHIPCAEMVRFGKNGSDATTAAIRLARAFAGRDLVAVCGYHGWHDWYIGTTSRHLGVPEAVRDLTMTFVYNDLDSLEALFRAHPDGFAAVILEPAGVHEPAPGFLAELMEVTHAHGALVIFDEIITGFRLGMGGAQAHYGVTPDLAAFGKALANGMPLSAVVGRAHIMRQMEEVFFSATFGGEALSLAAALATLRKLEKENVVAYLWGLGRQALEGLKGSVARYGLAEVLAADGPHWWPRLAVSGIPSASAELITSFLRQELVQRGILLLSTFNLCYAHRSSDLVTALAEIDQVLAELANSIQRGDLAARVRGQPIQPVFKVRN